MSEAISGAASRPRQRRSLRLATTVGAVALLLGGVAISPATAAPGDAAALSVYVPVAPIRVATVNLGAAATADVDLGSTVQPVPATATAAAFNVTVAGITAQTYVSVCPGGTPKADCLGVSTINPYAGRDVANFTIVTLGASPTGGNDGIVLYNNLGSVIVYLDLVGYYVDSAVPDAEATDFLITTPYRDNAQPTLSAGEIQTVNVDGVPAGATAVAVRATVAGVTSGTYISVCPGGQAKATCRDSSTLNPAAGRDTANMTIVPLGGPSADQIQVYNNRGSVQLYLDILGFQVPQGQGAQFLPVESVRYISDAVLDEFTYQIITDANAPAGSVGEFSNITTAGNTAVNYVSVCPGDVDDVSCLRSSTVNSYPGQDTAAGAVIAGSPLQGGGYDYNVVNSAGTTLFYVDFLGYFINAS